MAEHERRRVVLGYVSGLYGVQGWLKVYSYTEPRENILKHVPWEVRSHDKWVAARVEDGRTHGRGIVVKLNICPDREAARELLGSEIAVFRDQLPTPDDGEYYWADLLGMQVVTREGVALGRVSGFMETGANDVLVVTGERERLIPFVSGEVVLDVDPAVCTIRVDWDPEF